MPKRKRTPDESLDAIALFFENLRHDVEKNHGVYLGDDFSAGERNMLSLALRKAAREFRDRADMRRAEEILANGVEVE